MLYPVEIIEYKDEPQFRLAHSRVTLNPALTHLFDLPATFEEQLLSLLPTGELNLATPGLLAKDLVEKIPHLDLTLFTEFPKLHTAAEMKAVPLQDKPVLLPASALLLVEKSKNVAGLLHELDKLIERPLESFPPSLQAFLGETISTPSPEITDLELNFAPASLSPAQNSLLNSANEQPLTVCHGPPGTGKSFTVSAAALDQLARGQSVLIACRSDEAAAVIEAKINELTPANQLVMRAGRSKHLNKLKKLLDQLLATRPSPPPLSSIPEVEFKKQSRHLGRLHIKLQKRVESELKAAPLFHTPLKGPWQKIRHWRHRRTVHKKPSLSRLLSQIVSEQFKRLKILESYNKLKHERHRQKHLSLQKSRTTLKRYREAIGRRMPSSQERELLDLDLDTLVDYLPIWVTTTDDIHRVLPLKPGVFDLVIIDEATQCDLASALPILYRGKRALITGDPQQLRHLSFLSENRLSTLGKKHQLPVDIQESFHFRRISFLDRALEITAGTDSLHFLDEHFRSLPLLISFSNQHFYQGNLHCMREVETLTHQNEESAILIHPSKGSRNQQGANEEELKNVFHYLREILNQQTSGTPLTVGFLSPFRAQVDLFQKQIQENFTLAEQHQLLHQHQLIAGTAYSFQGAERDVMLISTVLDSDSPSAARRFLERPDVFNVSITRACHQIQLFTSISTNELPLDSLFSKYLRHASQQKHLDRAKKEKTSIIIEIEDLFRNEGWELLATVLEVAGMPIDLLFKKENRLIAIDLIGTPDHLGQAVSIEKTLLLKRAGLPLYPLSIAELQTRGKEILTEMLAQ